MHTLASTAQVDLLCRQVDLLLKQVDLLFATHFSTDLQQPEMVKTDKNDTGGAMEAHTHSAKTTMEHRLQETRQTTSCS